MAADIELQGMDELLQRLQEMGAMASRVENDALKAAAQPVAEEMADLVQLGKTNETHIKEDIQVSGVKTKDGIKFVTVGPGKRTNWRAKFLEFGTSKMPAIPFVAPAFEHKKLLIPEIIAQKLREALKL